MSPHVRPGKERRTIAVFVTVSAAFSAFLYWQFSTGELLSADDVSPRPMAPPPLEVPERREQPALPSTAAYPVPPELSGIDLSRQSAEEAAAKSQGCIVCHQGVCDPHLKSTVRLGCVDCHGGDPSARQTARTRLSPFSRRLAGVREPRSLLYATQPRIA